MKPDEQPVPRGPVRAPPKLEFLRLARGHARSHVVAVSRHRVLEIAAAC